MQAKSDAQLLGEYAEERAESSFAEIVNRHTNLVYSAALRQVDSPEVAAEISQNVFIGLARGARALLPRLTPDASLAGWLCRSARNLSLNHRRDEFRRTTRERQAMEQLDSSDAAPDWETLRPVLDDAMSELNEADYDALVLRFYNNQDLRSVGAALGVSEDTAQKRVARALEKLREHLAERKVTATTAALAVVISANAVQAAPIGLAASISSAAALAGTSIGVSAAATTTATATKTIAMTTLQKALIGAALVAAVGTGVYEAHNASTSRTHLRTLQQQQTSFAAQIQQLQRERDEATNRLTTVNQELALLKSQQKQAEVLKLRGQVGTLRQQVASAEAKNNASGFTKMMSDPAMREYIRQAMLDMVRRRYGALFEELKLTPEQTEQFTQLISAEFQKGAQKLAASPGTIPPEAVQSADKRPELEEELKSLLGEKGMARFTEYSQEIPARTTVDLLNAQLGAGKLTDEQRARLFELVKAEPFELTHGIAGDLDKAFFGSQTEIDGYVEKIAESNQRVLQQAGNFLGADQLTALNTVLTNGITARLTQAAAFNQKH